MSQDTRKDKRAKVVSLNVRYKSATIDEFIDNHSHDVSRGGVFVKTQTPFAPGTLLKFEIRLSGDQAVIAGVGRVVWKREPTQAGGHERPAGMGVKFIKVDDSSRVVIERLTGSKADAGSAYLSEPEGVAEDGPPQVGVTAASTMPKPGVAAPAVGSAPKPGGIGVPKIPGATPPPPSVVPRIPGAAPPAAAAPPPAAKAAPPAAKLPAPTPAPPVAKAPPAPNAPPQAPMAGAARAAPTARKATMMGIAPPTARAAGGATPPPPGIEPLGAPIMPASTGPSAPFRPGAKDPPPPSPPAKVELKPVIPRGEPKLPEMTLPKADPQLHVPTRAAPMFPKLGPESEPEIAHEPTVMKQAAELLEEALSAAGGSLDEIGDNPLFTGTAAPTHTGQPIAPLIPEDELPAATETGTLIMGARGVSHLMGEAGDPTGGESAIAPSVPPTSGLAPPIIAPTPPPHQVSSVPQPPPSQSGPHPAFTPPAPEKARAQVQSTPDAKKKGGGGTIALALLVLLLIGGGGFGAYKMGYLASVLGGGPQPLPSAQPSVTASSMVPPPSASSAAVPVAAVPEGGAAIDVSSDAGKASDAGALTAADAAAPAVSVVPVQQPVPVPRPRPRPQPQPQPQPQPSATEAPTAPTATEAPTTAPTPAPTSAPTSMPTATDPAP